MSRKILLFPSTAMETTADYTCAFCGAVNTTFIDLSAGNRQSYIEDCQVCCRPNILYLQVNEETLAVEVESEQE